MLQPMLFDKLCDDGQIVAGDDPVNNGDLSGLTSCSGGSRKSQSVEGMR
jgi:hypothetical protein